MSAWQRWKRVQRSRLVVCHLTLPGTMITSSGKLVRSVKPHIVVTDGTRDVFA